MQGTSLPGVGLVLSLPGVGLLLSVSEGGVTFVRVRRGFTFVCVRRRVTFPRRKTRFPFSPVADRIRGQEGPVSTVSRLHLTRGKSNPFAETGRDLGPDKGLEGRKRRSTIPRAGCETPLGTGFGLQLRSRMPGKLRRKQLLQIPLA